MIFYVLVLAVVAQAHAQTTFSSPQVQALTQQYLKQTNIDQTIRDIQSGRLTQQDAMNQFQQKLGQVSAQDMQIKLRPQMTQFNTQAQQFMQQPQVQQFQQFVQQPQSAQVRQQLQPALQQWFGKMQQHFPQAASFQPMWDQQSTVRAL